MICPSGAWFENRSHSTPSIRLGQNPKRVIVQWVGIGTHTHTHTYFLHLKSFFYILHLYRCHDTKFASVDNISSLIFWCIPNFNSSDDRIHSLLYLSVICYFFNHSTVLQLGSETVAVHRRMIYGLDDKCPYDTRRSMLPKFPDISLTLISSVVISLVVEYLNYNFKLYIFKPTTLFIYCVTILQIVLHVLANHVAIFRYNV